MHVSHAPQHPPPAHVAASPPLPRRAVAPVPVKVPDSPANPGNPAYSALTQYIWHGRFVPVVIAVCGDDVFLNGDRVVTPYAP